MGEGFETGGAVFGFVYFAGAEAMQQRAQDAPHMRVVVDDQKAQAVEIDANHTTSRAADAETSSLASVNRKESSLTLG
jgi:hypothetical protein